MVQQELLDICALGLAERIRAAVHHLVAGVAGGLATGRDDSPHDVAVPVEVHAHWLRAVTARARFGMAVLAPQVIGGYDIVVAVGVAAGHHPDVQRLEHHPDLGRFPGRPEGPAAGTGIGAAGNGIGDVSVVRIAVQQIRGQIDDSLGIHELARMHAAQQQDAVAVAFRVTRMNVQAADHRTFHRRLGQRERFAHCRGRTGQGCYGLAELSESVISRHVRLSFGPGSSPPARRSRPARRHRP
jgi:hypothetical protein